jgi:hypothetical protein
MDFLLFDAENKSATIELPELDRTIKLEDAGGKLKPTAPVHHAELIKNVIELSHKHLGSGITPVLTPMVIKQANSKRIQWKGEADKCPMENYLIERLVAKIQFKGSGQFADFPNAKGTMAVGISYTEKGIQMAFGHNVNICQNLNVFGDTVFSTYGDKDNRVPFDKGMQLLESWMQNFEDHRQINKKNIETLMARVITEEERLRIFGKIYEMAILKNAGMNEIDNPLNVTECNRMVTAGFTQITSKEKVPITAWDLTNWATSVLKPESSDMLNLLTKNSRLNSFLLNEFSEN